MNKQFYFVFSTSILMAFSLAAVGQEAGEKQPQAESPAKQAETPPAAEAPKPAQPSADDVLKELLRRRAESQLNEPKKAPAAPVQPEASEPAKPLGTAPAARKADAKLRREGSFILTRVGRLVRANDVNGAQKLLFAFDSDASGLGDPPLRLMPCRVLEDMETTVDQSGSATTFVLSGQIYTYRGENYLLPTMMKVAPDRGNLQP